MAAKSAMFFIVGFFVFVTFLLCVSILTIILYFIMPQISHAAKEGKIWFTLSATFSPCKWFTAELVGSLRLSTWKEWANSRNKKFPWICNLCCRPVQGSLLRSRYLGCQARLAPLANGCWNPNRIRSFLFVFGVEGKTNQVTWDSQMNKAPSKTSTWSVSPGISGSDLWFHDWWDSKENFWNWFKMLLCFTPCVNQEN